MHKTTIIFRHTPCNWQNGIVGIGSWLIRKITNSKYDHAERLIDGMVYSGTQKGVIRKPLTEWKKLYKDQSHHIVEVSVPISDKNFIILFNQLEGTGYDYLSLVAHLMYRITGKWLGKGRDGANKFYCTEFLAFASGMPNWFMWDVKMWEKHCKI